MKRLFLLCAFIPSLLLAQERNHGFNRYLLNPYNGEAIFNDDVVFYADIFTNLSSTEVTRFIAPGGDTLVIGTAGFSGSNSYAAGNLAFQYKDLTNTFVAVDTVGNVGIGMTIMAGTSNLWLKRNSQIVLESQNDNISGFHMFTDASGNNVFETATSNGWQFRSHKGNGTDRTIVAMVPNVDEDAQWNFGGKVVWMGQAYNESGNRVSIDSTGVIIIGGNVGLGTVLPRAQYSQEGSSPQAYWTDTDINKTRANFAGATDTSAFSFSWTNTGKPLFDIKGITGNSIVSVDSAGNYGIGTATPGYALHVRNNVSSGTNWTTLFMENAADFYAGFSIKNGGAGGRRWNIYQMTNALNQNLGFNIDGYSFFPIMMNTNGRVIINAAGEGSLAQSALDVRGGVSVGSYAETNAAPTNGMIISGSIGIGTILPDRLLHPEVSDAVTNAVTYGMRLSHITSGLVAPSFGVGTEYELENARGVNEIVGVQEYIYTDTTNASEDVDFVLKLMAAGAAAAEKFRISSTGQALFQNGIFSAPSIAFANYTGTGLYIINGVLALVNGGSASSSFAFGYDAAGVLKVSSVGGFSWSSDPTVTGTPDITLFRDAANTLALRNGTNPQEFRIWNSNAAADEFVSLGFINNSNTFTIETEAAGGGTVRNIALMGGNTGINNVSPDRLFHPEVSDAATNTVTYGIRLSHITSGLVAPSFGVGTEYELENARGVNELVATQEFIYTDTTNASEDVDFVLKLMAAGAAAAEKFRVSSTGGLSGITTLSMNNQLTNTLAIGTAPFAVTSTTVNTNLNADLLDGSHASAFMDSTLLKDLVTTAPLTGGVDDILPGADSDVILAITVLKDLVAGTGLGGGADDILTGADADVTVNVLVDYDGGIEIIDDSLNVKLNGASLASAAAGLSVVNDGHSHTGTTLSGVDISDDTNLSGNTEIVLTGDALSIAAAMTRDTEWATEALVQTAWGSVNILLATEINLSSELAALMDDEVGTGFFALSISPTFTGTVSAQNITLADPGTSANSYTITLQADNATTVQSGTIQVLFGADPYMRLSAPADGGAATPVMDLKDQTIVLFNAAAGVDYSIQVNGETNDGILTFLEDEKTWQFDAGISLGDTVGFVLTAPGAATISSRNNVILDTFGGAVLDTAVTLTGVIGQVVHISSRNAARDVVFQDTGNFSLGALRTLSDPADVLVMKFTSATTLKEEFFADNN